MAPRKRNIENRGLPSRWRVKGKAFYYQVPKGAEHHWDHKTEFKLGNSLEEAHRTFALKVGQSNGSIQTVAQLLDKYLIRVMPGLAKTTQRSQQQYLTRIRKVFGDMLISDLEPINCYQYLDKRTAKVSGKHEIALLKSALQYAIGWGDIRMHPLKDVKLKMGPSKRDRYVTDEEILALLAHEDSSHYGTKMCKAYIKLKLLSGLRKADMLRLSMSDIRDDGLFSPTHKNGKGILFEWTPLLREAVDEALQARPALSKHLFCTRRGLCMVNEVGRTGAFDSLWKDFINRVNEEETVVEHFTEHDLRGKVGSDAESDERAAQLLGHSTTAVTRKHYRRKVAVIKPAK